MAVYSPIYKMKMQEALQKPTYATVMALALTDICGGSVEWLEWDPDAIKASFEDIQAGDIPQENYDRLFALQIALTSNEFYVSAASFIDICNALGSDGVDFKMFDPADMEEMLWARTEINLHDPDGEHEPFSDEVATYVGVRAQYEGFSKLPGLLSFGKLEKSRIEATGVEGMELEMQAALAREDSDLQELELDIVEKLEDLQNRLMELPLNNADATAYAAIRDGISKATQRSAVAEEQLSPGFPW